MPKVNHEILSWARETAGLNPEEAAKILGFNDTSKQTALKKLEALENGQVVPSRAILVIMAKQYRRPLLTFYLSSKPRIADRGNDFRTLPQDYNHGKDALIDALIRDIQVRQSMVRATLEESDEAVSLQFINSFDISADINEIVASIKETLSFNLDEFRAQNNTNEAFSYIRTKTESIGIYVLMIGNLGSYHTSLDVDVFRGFAIADDIAPFIVINDQDAKSAWSFTLLHELAHLWLGQSGISNYYSEIKIEKFCNEVASEFLLPRSELRSRPKIISYIS